MGVTGNARQSATSRFCLQNIIFAVVIVHVTVVSSAHVALSMLNTPTTKTPLDNHIEPANASTQTKPAVKIPVLRVPFKNKTNSIKVWPLSNEKGPAIISQTTTTSTTATTEPAFGTAKNTDKPTVVKMQFAPVLEMQSSDVSPMFVDANDSISTLPQLQRNFSDSVLPRMPIFPGHLLFSPSMASRLESMRPRPNRNQNGMFGAGMRQSGGMFPLGVPGSLQQSLMQNQLGLMGSNLMSRPGLPPMMGLSQPSMLSMLSRPGMSPNMNPFAMGLQSNANGLLPNSFGNDFSSSGLLNSMTNQNRPLGTSSQFTNSQFGSNFPGSNFNSLSSSGLSSNPNFRFGLPSANLGGFNNGFGGLPLGMGLNSSFGLGSSLDVLNRPASAGTDSNGLTSSMLNNNLFRGGVSPALGMTRNNFSSANTIENALGINGLGASLQNPGLSLPPQLLGSPFMRPPLSGLPFQNMNFLLPQAMQANPLLSMRAGLLPPPMFPPTNLIGPDLGLLSLRQNSMAMNPLMTQNQTFDVLSGGVFAGSNKEETILGANDLVPLLAREDNQAEEDNEDEEENEHDRLIVPTRINRPLFATIPTVIHRQQPFGIING